MSKRVEKSLVPIERIASAIYLIRDQKVMIDSDLADMYGVTTGALNQAVKRNADRFPEHFMFQMADEEFENWKSQIVISNPSAKMALRRPPNVFTEQGVAMLSAVLRSKQAVQVSIAIMDTFVRLRQMLAAHEDIARKIDEHDEQIAALYKFVKQLLETPSGSKHPIGYIWPKENE